MNSPPTSPLPENNAADPARAALLAKIQQSYSIQLQRVAFTGLEIEIIKPADPDAILEEAVQSEEDGGDENPGWQPYWAEAWESALALGALLIEKDRRCRKVIDLGCGLGVSGCVAAALGAEVVLGDSAPPSIDFAQWNAWPWRERTNVRLLDWNSDRLEHLGYDVILGADILYERDSWRAQEAFCRYHLSKGGEVLLSEPRRGLSDDFQKTWEALGWKIECWYYHPTCIPKPIRMFSCRPV